MINKHFFKTLLLFTAMIGLSLLFIFAINYYGGEDGQGGSNTATIVK